MKLFSFFIMVSFIGFNSIQAQSKDVPELKTPPNGTYIKGKSLIATKGYHFERVSGSTSKMVLLRDNGGGLGTTTFQCACKLGTEAGDICEADISSSSITCKAQGCSSCFLYVSTSLATKVLYLK